MRTILIPVDFSPASLNAVHYAHDLARAVNASMTLVYVCQYPVSFNEVNLPAQVYADIVTDAHSRILQLKTDLLHTNGESVKIYTEIKEGNVMPQVEELASIIKPYAIVIGSHGAGKAERLFFGSNAVAAIRRLSWPLIIVPKGVRFRTISRIGLACDLKNVIESVHAEIIKKLVSEFHAELHVLYVNTEEDKKIGDEEIEGSGWLGNMLQELKPRFHIIHQEKIEEALDEFASKNNLDLLITIPKQHGFLERLMHKSHSTQLMLNTQVPVMSIHE